jgi:ribosomal protein S18 acetylase RimI-like enzyme
VRRRVLRPDSPENVELPGDKHPGAVHLGVFVDGLVVACCLIYAEECPAKAGIPAWRLRGMATDPDARGAGNGKAVLSLAYDIARADGAEIIWCHARDSAIGFYERDNWIGSGEPFDEIGIAHLLMWRPLLGCQ